MSDKEFRLMELNIQRKMTNFEIDMVSNDYPLEVMNELLEAFGEKLWEKANQLLDEKIYKQLELNKASFIEGKYKFDNN
tara:strand:+ start:2313 stop:2549 length:237 start_codon:yes stop_codon:yes gene_type:complete